jgi:hypothetical protein
LIKCKYNTKKCNTKFSETVHDNLEKRGKYYMEHVVIHFALFLDPRYQGLLSFSERSHAKLHLRMLWSKIECLSNNEKNKPIRSFGENINSADCHDEFSEFINTLKKKNRTVCGTNTVENNFNIMAVLEGFDGVGEIEKIHSVLKYWEEQRNEHPQLYLLSSVVYGVPATQVTVERAFSSLRYILSSLRENLNEEILENILMIRLNWK